jgi:hypothetical protein
MIISFTLSIVHARLASVNRHPLYYKKIWLMKIIRKACFHIPILGVKWELVRTDVARIHVDILLIM